MIASILIVSKNRKAELQKTIEVLENIISYDDVEIMVFLDGSTDDSVSLKKQYIKVKWLESPKSIGASAARNLLYKQASGKYIFGFDDDAHPLNTDFLDQSIALFQAYPKVAIIAFEEVKGVFENDNMALSIAQKKEIQFFTNEFIGCGFVIKKSVYDQTNGFPKWVDIYGEESCLSIEVIALGYEILFSNTIKVNHRVNKSSRFDQEHHYFRFQKQLKNTTYYYIVYHKNPMLKILKLYWHNFYKYGLKDSRFFVSFFKTIFVVIKNIFQILKYRKPVNEVIINKLKRLKPINF